MVTQRTGVTERASAKENIVFRGHPNVKSLHPTTIEVTKDDNLTSRGDCIVGVSADKGCSDLQDETKAALRSLGSKVVFKISVGPESFVFHAMGNPRLELSHPHDIVVRKSEFLSERTLAVKADMAAKDIPRSLVAKLRDPRNVGTLAIEVQRYG
jgi:uncharacterized protein